MAINWSGLTRASGDVRQSLIAHFAERQRQKELQDEIARQQRQQAFLNIMGQREMGMAGQRLGLEQQKFGEEQRQWNEGAPLRKAQELNYLEPNRNQQPTDFSIAWQNMTPELRQTYLENMAGYRYKPNAGAQDKDPLDNPTVVKAIMESFVSTDINEDPSIGMQKAMDFIQKMKNEKSFVESNPQVGVDALQSVYGLDQGGGQPSMSGQAAQPQGSDPKQRLRNLKGKMTLDQALQAQRAKPDPNITEQMIIEVWNER